MDVPKGKVVLQAFEELQVCLGPQPLVFALRGEDTAEVFGEILLPGQTYTILPHTFFSITTATRAELDVLGDPLFADVTGVNKQSLIHTVNLVASLNKVRAKGGGGVNVMIVGSPKTGKSALCHTIVRHSERAGWRPVTYSLDPSGTTPFVASTAMQGQGALMAHIGDRKDDPSNLVALIDRAESSGNKLEVLKDWAVSNQHKPDRKSVGTNPADLRSKVMGLIGNLARREAVGLSADDSDPAYYVKGTDVSATTLTSSYSWERFLRPLDDQSEDTVGVWCGLSRITPAMTESQRTLYMKACLTLREMAKARLMTTDIFKASGSVIDCPAGLTADMVITLAKAYEVSVILCVGDVDLHTRVQSHCNVIPWQPFQSKCPPEVLQRITQHQAIRQLQPAEKLLLPRLKPSDPATFIKECTRAPPIAFCGTAAPIPARLLLTPISLQLKLAHTVSPTAICLLSANAESDMVEVSIDKLPLNQIVHVGIGYGQSIGQISSCGWARRTEKDLVELVSGEDATGGKSVRVFLGQY